MQNQSGRVFVLRPDLLLETAVGSIKAVQRHRIGIKRIILRAFLGQNRIGAAGFPTSVSGVPRAKKQYCPG